MSPIDPGSPVPLYHQIAQEIRERIQSGRLAPGQVLEPLRQAAESWGVHLHTVRHAYTALAREGLVETRRPLGTRVCEHVPGEALEGGTPSLTSFVDRCVAEARSEHGLTPGQLAEAIVSRAKTVSAAKPIVYIVECSAWQCATHADELRALYELDARAWPLERGTAPPEDGVVLSTYFHYNDVRRVWPRRLKDVRFLAIELEPELPRRLDALRGRRKQLRTWVVERDEITAENVASDATALLPRDAFDVRALPTEDPVQALERIAKSDVALFAPRVWGAMNDEQRDHPRALEARYVFDSQSLAELGAALGWTRHRVAAHSAHSMLEQ